MDHYKTAQICLNGHCVTSTAEKTQLLENFCSLCGARTITHCQSCSTPIRGHYSMDNVAIFCEYEVPSYCYNCGKPYPWTESALQAAAELLALDDNLTLDESQSLVDALPDLLTETPRTQLAVAKFKKFLSSATQFTVDSVRQFAIDFGCTYVKSELSKLGL